MATAIPRAIGRAEALRRSRWRDFDSVLLVSTLLLLGFGVAVIASVSGPGSTPISSFVLKQLIATGAGLVAMTALTLINYRLLASLAIPVYLLNLGLLLLVSRVGTTIGGSTRWFDLGFFLFQPSLFAQLFMVLSMAALLARWQEQIRRLPYLLATLAVMGVPAFLVFRQPDLGSALVFGFLWLVLIVASPARRWHILALLLLSIPVGWFAWHYLAADYMRARFLIFLNPESDPTGEGYNIIQARIAIGHGGMFGEGLAGGSQSQLQFLRVQQIDFIFAAASEQFGFVGSLALFVLYTLVMWRCLVVAGRAPDPYGQYLCVGVVAVMFFLAVVNIGMNMGLMPVTGIPLPFISYGGSSLVVLLAMQGLVQSVAIRWRKLTFG
jgi:rod shape determining protein RodA